MRPALIVISVACGGDNWIGFETDQACLSATKGGMGAESVQRPIVAVGRRGRSFLSVIQRAEPTCDVEN